MARQGTRMYSLILMFLICNFANAANEEDETKLLLSFKASITDPSRILSDWNSGTDFCNWFGISCINSSHVSQIELSGKNISGKLSPSLFHLPFISIVDLSNNELIGELPEQMFSCFSLRNLNLSNNNFTGIIPKGASHDLETLDLSSNMLSGEIPSDIHLFSSLKYLDIGGNVLMGTIPKSISKLQNLRFLTLASNQLVGEIPVVVSQMKNLEWIYFGYNNLSGKIPNELGLLSSLNHLDLVYNNFTGEIPSSLGNLTNLQYLFLYQNRLTGSIPRTLFGLKNLISLDLSVNYLSGEIPEHVGELKNLEILQLFSNNFTGTIPNSLVFLPRLRTLQLWSNQLSGEIPQSLGEKNNLTVLDLSTNNLTGKIPEGLCASGHFFNLILFANLLEGEIPKSLSGCRSLQRIRIQNNRLSGELSPEFTKLPLLYYLDISSNNFSGRIDWQKWEMPALQMLSLANNKFFGNLPEFFHGNQLDNLDLSGNYFLGSIPVSYGDLSELMQLNLDQNQLTGFIPEALSLCKNMVVLDLSQNMLTGQIPIGFSKMSVLSQLDLSQNHLSGEIPPNLGEVESLVQINISHNQLYGCLPTTLAFFAINASAVVGNDLCGGDSNSGLPPCKGTRKPVSMFFITSLAVVLLVLSLSTVVVIFICRRNKLGQKKVINDEYGVWDLRFFDSKASKLITIDDILSCMNEENIDNNGTFYRGNSISKGIQFVVKKLMDGHSLQSDFWTEMEEQGSARHHNLVKLLGICRSEKDGILVHEFIDGNNLSKVFYGLNWESRRKVAIGIAKALRFLHFRCFPSLLVGDLSMNNVIIDGKDEPRLLLSLPGTVGTCKDSKGFFSSTYLAPETIKTKEITNKGDIYAFGILLIELVTGKHSADAEVGVPYGNIVDWARYCYSECHINTWIDVALKGQLSSYQHEVLETMNLGIQCTAQDPTTRPSSKDVVKTLEAVMCSGSCFSRIKSWVDL